MNCPKCGEEMEEGYFWIHRRADQRKNFWSTEEPIYFWKGFSKIKQKTQVLASVYPSSPNKEQWLRKGYRRGKCKLITFEYK